MVSRAPCVGLGRLLGCCHVVLSGSYRQAQMVSSTYCRPCAACGHGVPSPGMDGTCTLSTSRHCSLNNLWYVTAHASQVEQQRFMVQPFSILTNNHAARASSSMVTATSAAGSSAADADDSQEAATLREGFSQHLRQQQLMRQRRRQLALQQQQQQQQMAHMQRSAVQAGFSADDAARLAAAGYWGSGVTGSQAGMLRGPGTGMYGQQGANGLLGAPGYGMQWPYKGPLIGTMGGDGGYSRQQQEMLMQGAEGGVQLKRGSSQGRQQGRLGRMASRIYALRPRLRKGDSGGERSTLASAGQAASAGSGGSAGVAAGLYSSLSASFKNGLAALTSADAAAASDAAASTAEGVPAAAVGGADGAEAQAAATDASDSAQQLLDLSDTPAVLASLGLPQDSVVVGPQYYIGGPQGPAAKYSSLNPRYAPHIGHEACRHSQTALHAYLRCHTLLLL